MSFELIITYNINEEIWLWGMIVCHVPNGVFAINSIKIVVLFLSRINEIIVTII
jgi:hypothetical protein